jgi:hypothetical protein
MRRIWDPSEPQILYAGRILHANPRGYAAVPRRDRADYVTSTRLVGVAEARAAL